MFLRCSLFGSFRFCSMPLSRAHQTELALETSVLAGDISQEDRDAIIAHDNGDWRCARYVHYAIADAAGVPALSEGEAKETAKLLVRTSLGSGCPLALLYRWKHMPRAQAFLERGRMQHDLLPRCLQRMWSAKVLAEAVQAAEMAANVDELSYQTRAAAKASAVMRFFENDKGAVLQTRAQILTLPAHVYINLAMKADKASLAFASAIAFDHTSASTQASMVECQRQNFRFVSGNNGRRVLEMYSSMVFDLGHTMWSRLQGVQKLEAARLMLCPMANLWSRAVFYFEDTRFQTFEATTPDGGQHVQLQPRPCGSDSCKDRARRLLPRMP